MANARLSVLATQLQTNAAAVAAAAAGSIVTSDIQALASVLAALAVNIGAAVPALNYGTTTANQATMLTPT